MGGANRIGRRECGVAREGRGQAQDRMLQRGVGVAAVAGVSIGEAGGQGAGLGG